MKQLTEVICLGILAGLMIPVMEVLGDIAKAALLPWYL